MNRNPLFGKLLNDIMDIDVEEVIDHINHSQLEEIQKRPRFKLNDDLFYVKNSYDYFKITPIHYLADIPEFREYDERIAAYQMLKCIREDAISDKTREDEISEFLLENNLVDSNDFRLTSDGIEWLNSMGWIECYLTFLDRFDFTEFENHLKKGDDFMNAAAEFLEKHYRLALKRHDLKAQFDAQASKALYHVVNGNFTSALDEEIKLFMVRLNPTYRSENELLFHEAVNQVNIHNLNSLFEICKTNDFEELFKRNWKSLDMKNLIIGEEESFDIFSEAVMGMNPDDLNRRAEKHYLDI